MDSFLNIKWAAIPQILVAIFLLIQGLLVLIENPRSALHRAFFFLQLPITLWLTAMGMAYLSKNTDTAFIWAKIGFLGVMFIPIGTYSFSVYYAEEKKQEKIIYFGLALTLLLAFFINHPEFSQGVFQYPWGYYIKLGPMSYGVLGLFAIFVPLFIYNFFLKYKRSPPEQRHWYFFALMAGAIAFFASIDFLPAYGITSFLPLGYLFVGCFVTLMGYYILRHSLSDIKIKIGRTIGYILLTYFLFFIYTGVFILIFPLAQNISLIIFNAILFIIALYVFSFLKQKSQMIVDEIFFKEKIDFQNLITNFNNKLRNLIDIHTLIKTFFSFLTDSLRTQKPAVLIFEQKSRRWLIYEYGKASAYKERRVDAVITEKFLQYFIKHPLCFKIHDLVIFRDSALQKSLAKLFSSLKAEVLIPLVYRSTFLGFIILSKKLSAENYGFKEIQALNNLSSPFCIAWENAKLYESIQNSSKLKSDFVSIASHQLRTPLTSLKWALKTLANGEIGAITPEQKDMLNKVCNSTDNMIQIVNQWLDIARIEENKKEKGRKAMSLSDLCLEVSEEFKHLIRGKNISFSYSMPKNLPKILANREYIKTVLSILFDNAIRYTPNNGKISCSTKKTLRNEIEFSIQDSGIGIPKSQEVYIFNKFFRASNSVSCQPNGSGLGLFYAKTLIENQGGVIWFRSEENKGSTFFFTLPRTKKFEKKII